MYYNTGNDLPGHGQFDKSVGIARCGVSVNCTAVQCYSTFTHERLSPQVAAFEFSIKVEAVVSIVNEGFTKTIPRPTSSLLILDKINRRDKKASISYRL